jgi:hypothetical protein
MGLIRSLALCCLTALLIAAPASAAITASTIAAPADGSELFFNGDTGSGSVTVEGTVTGAAVNAKGDLLCYAVGDTKATKLESGIDVSRGTFATSASLAPIAGFACRLALVPSGKTPTGDAAAVFAGPAISVSDQFSHSSAGDVFGYYVLAGTLPWSWAAQSAGECAINSSFATDPSTLGSFSLFVGNACLPRSSGVGPAAGTRSSLVLDGLNAYTPAAISNLTSLAGFEPLTYNAGFDANHDAAIITDSETPTICEPPATFPPTSTTCPSLYDSGLRLQQTTVLLPSGQVARVTHKLTSVDGKPHMIDVLFSQSVSAQSSGDSPGFQFPGQASFATHSVPYSFSTFPPGPGSIIIISDAAGLLPATSNPIGAITYGRPPQSVDFISAKRAQTATFLMHYADSVPAGGSVIYDWSFSQGSSSGSLTTLEAIERDRFYSPSVTIRNPRNGSTTTRSQVRIQGQASDPIGISSLSVGGRGVVLRANNIFGATVGLHAGKNVITTAATNVAGNTGGTSITVTYKPPPCKVPKLRGKTLSGARRALGNSGCKIGKVKRVRSRSVRKGRVTSTSPRAGDQAPARLEGPARGQPRALGRRSARRAPCRQAPQGLLCAARTVARRERRTADSPGGGGSRERDQRL